MRVTTFSFPLAALAACSLSVARAHADVITLGSDLSAPATIAEANQADTAFWPASIKGADPTVPVDGQVTSIQVKGTAVQPPGAPKPLNEFHFQTLDSHGDGNYQVYLSSAAFELPYTGDRDQVNTFTPDNLCVHKGGVVAFNDEGGWDSTYAGPYASGVPFRIFGSVPNSSTQQFSKDNGTKNGALLAPPTLRSGTELLLRYTLATGDDRSYDCGGPMRDSQGKAIPRMRVGAGQNVYVPSTGDFTVFGYCGNPRSDCSDGTATLTVNGRTIASAPFSAKSQTSIKIPFKLSLADYGLLASAPGAAWSAVVTLTSAAQGTMTGAIGLRTKAGGVLHVVSPQRVYVRNNRQLTPAGFCGLASGCSGTASLRVGGKAVATARFATKSKGPIKVAMRLPAKFFRQVKSRPIAATLALNGALGSDSAPVLLRH